MSMYHTSIAVIARRGSLLNNQNKKNESLESGQQTVNLVKFVPTINYNIELENFKKNLQSHNFTSRFTVYNEVNIKAIIYVKKNFLNMIDCDNHNRQHFNSLVTKSVNKSGFHSMVSLFRKAKIGRELVDNQCGYIKHPTPIGEVHVIWSADSWKSYKTISAMFFQQTKDHFIYETMLKNADEYVLPGKTIEFATCFINDATMFKDTNNGNYYSFQRIDKTIAPNF